jgi:phosphoribosyl 1,2-cyclic phosphodiesterase
MQVAFCGVRGSTPAPGVEFVRYGGATSCVALAHDGADPSLVLDAGTGLQRLTRLLGDRAFRGSLLLGHLHWDHVYGMPFFQAGARPDSRVDVHLPAQGADAEAVLARMMAPPLFPITPSQLGAGWSFSSLDAGRHAIEGFDVLALDIPHKGGRTFGYRVEDGTTSVAYLSDHDPLALGAGPDGVGALHEAALELTAGVDLLIHDAQLHASELDTLGYLGHAAVEYAVALGAAAGVGKVGLFHHGPERTDDELDALATSVRSATLPVVVLRELDVVELRDAREPAPVGQLTGIG